MATIQRAMVERKSARKRIGVLFAAISSAIGVYFLTYAINAFQASGFGTYLSLAFSDSRIVFGNFSTFLLSLVDSAPLFALTLCLVAVTAILASVRYVATAMREYRYQPSLFN